MGRSCRPCCSEVTLGLPVEGGLCQSLASLGQQVGFVEATHAVLLIMDVVGDVLEVLQVGSGRENGMLVAGAAGPGHVANWSTRQLTPPDWLIPRHSRGRPAWPG